MTNLYSKENFTATTTAGNTYSFYCYFQSTQTGFRHLCYDYPVPNAKRTGYEFKKDYIAKQCWCNRTWERFTYETVLTRAIETVAKTQTDREELKAILIDKTQAEEAKQAKEFFNDFKATYDQLPQTAKNALANSNIMLETETQAKDILQTMKLINAIDKVITTK